MRLPIPSGCGLGVAMGAARKGPDEAVCINRFHPGLRCMPNYPLILCACDSGDRTGAPDRHTFCRAWASPALKQTFGSVETEGHTAGHESRSDVTTYLFSH